MFINSYLGVLIIPLVEAFLISLRAGLGFVGLQMKSISFCLLPVVSMKTLCSSIKVSIEATSSGSSSISRSLNLASTLPSQ